MLISKITFTSKPRNCTEIQIEWESGETTLLLFNSAYPLQLKEYYIRAIHDAMDSHQIISFNELYGLFNLWFARNNMIKPISVATFSNKERKRIGSRIREIREEQGIEAKKLALITGIDAANISKIEQGKISAGIDTLSKIANALGYELNFVKRTAQIIW